MALKVFETGSYDFQVKAHLEALDGNVLLVALKTMGHVFSEMFDFYGSVVSRNDPLWGNLSFRILDSIFYSARRFNYLLAKVCGQCVGWGHGAKFYEQKLSCHV